MFLPLLIVAVIFITFKTLRSLNVITQKDKSKWKLKNMKSSLSISLSSKIGTGAIIGVLTAMWKTSDNGVGGEGIVLWVFIGMFLLVPLTYSEVLYTQITKRLPRDFIQHNISKKAGTIYTVSLVVLYSFGFVGFQFTGIQSVIKMTVENNFDFQFSPTQLLLYIVLPIILVVSTIVITKNHNVFINTLSSLISFIILLYVIFFLSFLSHTIKFVPQYMSFIWEDFIKFRSASIGIPIGLIIGFQRIIQVSETGLGTSALASSYSENSPRREALIQMLSTIITNFIAVVITSYVVEYGRYNLSNVALSQNGFERIYAYLTSAISVTGILGKSILIFFVLSGFTTILGSFHFINVSMRLSDNKKIAFYIFLITSSGILSISNFDVIFDISDLLMFVASSLNIIAMFTFALKDIKKYRIRKNGGI